MIWFSNFTSWKMRTVNGDITQSGADYIVQQCNCLTVRSHGLSQTLEQKFLHGSLYPKRRPIGSRNLAIPEDRPQPGTAVILPGSPNIVCLFGQWRPGKIATSYFDSYPESTPPETTAHRLSWFTSSLWSLGNYLRATSGRKVTVAVPYKIGCGLAGGPWDDYHRVLQEFSGVFGETVELMIWKLS